MFKSLLLLVICILCNIDIRFADFIKDLRVGCPLASLQATECFFLQAVRQCEKDWDCPTGWMCCVGQCGSTFCIEPQERPGACPTNGLGDCLIDRLRCGTDKECRGNKKCCETKCGGSVCKDPVFICKDDLSWRQDIITGGRTPTTCRNCSCEQLRHPRHDTLRSKVCTDNFLNVRNHCCHTYNL